MGWNSITGVMERRLLVNWRVPVEGAMAVLPRGVRPRVVGGWALAGLCLVRVARMRPVGMPGWVGALAGGASEHVAVRMGVEWDDKEGVKRGVMIFKRVTGSGLVYRVGAWMGFGVQHRGRFVVEDRGPQGDKTEITVMMPGEYVHVRVAPSGGVMRGSVFGTVEEAVEFFRSGPCGYSPGRREGEWCGAQLEMAEWDLKPLAVEAARSTALEGLFGEGLEVDSAFVMRGMGHTWSPCGVERWGAVRRSGQERVPTKGGRRWRTGMLEAVEAELERG